MFPRPTTCNFDFFGLHSPCFLIVRDPDCHMTTRLLISRCRCTWEALTRLPSVLHHSAFKLDISGSTGITLSDYLSVELRRLEVQRTPTTEKKNKKERG